MPPKTAFWRGRATLHHLKFRALRQSKPILLFPYNEVNSFILTNINIQKDRKKIIIKIGKNRYKTMLTKKSLFLAHIFILNRKGLLRQLYLSDVV